MLLNPVSLRRVESLAIFIVLVAAYFMSGYSWWVFLLCFFLPDAGAIGYLKSPRLGGIMYNIAHWYVWPILLGMAAIHLGSVPMKMGALIWGSHLAFDRMLGWGFKTPESFYHTGMGEKSSRYRKTESAS